VNFFCTEGWRTILKKLYDCGFSPYISTKVPITKTEINDAYDIGLREIQISLDSIDSELLQQTLNVNDIYFSHIQDTIRNLDNKGIKLIIKSTLTKTTCTITNMKKLLNFVCSLKHVKRYTFTAIAHNYHKPVDIFVKIRPTIQQINDIYNYIFSLKLPYDIKADIGASIKKCDFCNYTSFKNRSLCSANVDSFIILPDGKVTICEDMYWDKNFLIGDITKSTITEVWNSNEAMALWNIQKAVFPDDSECKVCQDFENCRYKLGVCWKIIMSCYGKSNWLYPDPRCPKAPCTINPVFYDEC
jgi:radical SAM protein with 4Fe4S-binding SPASM domain